MHMLGFYHEHQRADRDNFVKINFGNVKRAFDFDMIQEPNLTEYDNGSIMQYPRVIANTNLVNDPKKDTIIPKRSLDFETFIGQRGRLSSKDIEAINTIYPIKEVLKPIIFETSVQGKTSHMIFLIVCILIFLYLILRRSFIKL